MDTSEAERIFSLMNDIKTSERASLGQRNLAALMSWHYHGHKLKPWQVPVHETFKEFRAMAADRVFGRSKHSAAVPIVYDYKVNSEGGGNHPL